MGQGPQTTACDTGVAKLIAVSIRGMRTSHECEIVNQQRLDAFQPWHHLATAVSNGEMFAWAVTKRGKIRQREGPILSTTLKVRLGRS